MMSIRWNVRSITKIKEEMKGGGDIQVGFSGITKARSWPWWKR